ncbi:hypothetical protein AL532_17720 [Pseudomonas monteilii]|uniref:hypothetical protein n=1 Tax=Pseudomonas TaxID=286 RepID=UPI000CEB46AF|nr:MULTISPECIES: hypothetical protein [Pseudomonas]AVH38048.1 hypothetical protein AL532_17720 [Pseudomonas monteilii]MCA4076439.1 hypothetical protein [Pseudomonas kurunegalensis]MDM9594679.1 hypothetical protein [Pseudomonas guariconensis]MDM9607509.1 hypothetical protein [Pseudomonas guariconensis]MEB3843498.1 hypothetical protein [Pseudomonas guariconensis]
MYEYIIHNDATADIRKVIGENRSIGLKLFKTIEQLRADQDAMDRLTQKDWGGSPNWPKPRHATFNTGPWVEAQDARMNLWRLRFFDDDLAGFRFIHAFFPAYNRYVLLAVVEKAEFGMIHDERFNYELQHPTSQRIACAYRQLVEEW